MSCENYFVLNPNQEELINKEYNVTQNEVEEMVEMIKNWIKLQPHLPFDEAPILGTMIKYMLRANKMSVERTKRKLEDLFSVPHDYPEYFQNVYPLHPRICAAMDISTIFPLRKPWNNLTRIIISKLIDPDPTKLNAQNATALFPSLMATRAVFDMCIFECYIMDCKGTTFAHALKINPVVLARAVLIYQKVFSNRISAIHYLNVPSQAIPIIKAVKKVLPEKLAKRIHFHENIDSLHKHIPRELLPEDYGGTEMESLKMLSLWKTFLKDNNDLLLKTENYKSAEELRTPTYNSSFGTDGSFRKLEID